MNDAPSAAGAAYRGFLFSDVRGFTSFAERHGNAAAAEMVARFLELARAAIAQHDGAEIKTEGDNIHAVFPSASSAVMCGLEIVDAAADLSLREPDNRLELGVGVHAGEAVETAEGYIGTAVNLAARLCAVARPGEVLVSDTVKNMTQASIPVGFIARGRRRLKGISKAVETFAVTRDTTARTAVVLPRVGMLLGIGGSVAAALVVIAVLAATILPGAGAIGSPGPSAPSATLPPVAIGPLPVGSYATQQFEPAFTFDVATSGWSAAGDSPTLLDLVREGSPAGALSFARVDEVLQSPCTQAGDPGSIEPVPTDVIAELAELHDWITLTAATDVEVGGLPARQVDVTIADSALAACGGVVGADVSVFGIGGETWGAAGGERFRLIAVQVGDATVTILISLDWAQAHSVQQLEAMMEFGEQLLAGVHFPVPAGSAIPAAS
jgi:class 3 adenylate cyclase